MRKRIFLAALASLFMVSGSLRSQIYVEFEQPKKMGNRPYTPLPTGGGTTVYTASSFTVPPNVDPDDGFTAAALPFPFEFNGTVYNWIAICVNGFVMMMPDGNIPFGVVGQQIQTRLFDGSQFPRNVIAPYWGDHYFRIGGVTQPGYMPSQVLSGVVNVGGRRAFCVEWRNLNINDKTLPSSVGNFQLYMYEQTAIPGNSQGDIEFAYGQIGGNPNTTLTTVITRNASIGLKGSSPQGDWINAFFTTVPPVPSYQSVLLSNSWQPSGGSDTVFVFKAIPRLRLNVWGDGDADFSQAPGFRHNGRPQSEFVTASDALSILRAVATNKPLDSLVKRQAFKGDVDHNGRFYYSTRNFTNTADTIKYRREIKFRTPLPRNNWTLDEHFALGSPATQDSLLRLHTLNMPSDNSLDFQSMYFQVNAYDAALIMHFLGARIITLPWTIDSIVPFGKSVSSTTLADNIKFDNSVKIGEGLYRIPVYLNGTLNNAMSAVFTVNAVVASVESNSVNTLALSENNKVAIAGSVKSDGTEPIAFINVRSEAESINFSSIEFNGDFRTNQTIKILTSSLNEEEILNVGSPNPFSNANSITLQIPSSGNYSLRVFDIAGNEVNTIFSGILNKGQNVFVWDGRSDAGSYASSGIYIYRLEGNSINASKSIILDR